VSQKLKGKLLADAPKWQRFGIKAYEAFRTVFFLDRIRHDIKAGDFVRVPRP